jgi:uncharacterized protein
VSKLRIVRMSVLKTAPWKNGGGVTREIAVCRVGDELAWRLSMADVASDGPFSPFEGVTRILTVIDGNGMELISANGTQEALFGSPIRFDGALRLVSKLKNGSLRDLNLMFNPILCDGDVNLVTGPWHQVLKAGPSLTIAVCGLRGSSQIDSATQLFAGDTMLLETGSVHLTLADGAEALLITLAWPDQTDASSSVTAAR